MGHIAIAIDGPSGAGKSTLARMAAGRLGFIYADTGALYRAVGLHALRRGADTKDADAVGALLPDIRVEMRHDEAGIQRILLNGEDVSDLIRTPEVSMAASDVSALPPVRAFLLDTQRQMAEKYDVIMDGRDIGTVVLPQAQVKIFLTASARERAMRRCRELRERGVETDLESVLRDMVRRDRNDSSRALAPLRPAQDAVMCDTTDLDLDASLELILDIVKKRLADGA